MDRGEMRTGCRRSFLSGEDHVIYAPRSASECTFVQRGQSLSYSHVYFTFPISPGGEVVGRIPIRLTTLKKKCQMVEHLCRNALPNLNVAKLQEWAVV